MKSNQGLAVQVLAVWVAMLGVSFYDFQPFLVGGLVTFLALSEAQAGLIATINMLGACAGLLLVSTRAYHWPTSRLILGALVLIVVANVGSGFALTFETLGAWRFVGGLGEGLVLAVPVKLAARFGNPDRLFAWIMFGQSLYGVAGLAAAPYLMDAFGLRGLFFGFATLALLTMPFFRALPDGGAPRKPSGRTVINTRMVLVFASLMILYMATNCVWAYYERIGVAMDISGPDIGLALAAGLFASMVGALIAAALGGRLRRSLMMYVGVGASALSVWILYLAQDLAPLPPYVASVMLLFGATGFVVPFYMGELAGIARTGRLPIVGYIVILLGNMLGPAVGAGLIGDGSYSTSYSPMILGALTLALIALVLIVAAQRLAPDPVTAAKPGS